MKGVKFTFLSLALVGELLAQTNIDSFQFIPTQNGKFDITSHRNIYYGVIPKEYYKENLQSWDETLDTFAYTTLLEPAPSLVDRYFLGATTSNVELPNGAYVLYSDFRGFTPVTALNYIQGINLLVELLTTRIENSFALQQEEKSKLQQLVLELPKYIEASKAGVEIVKMVVDFNYYLAYITSGGDVSSQLQEMKNFIDSVQTTLDTINISDHVLSDQEQYFFGYDNKYDFAMQIARYLKDYSPSQATLTYFEQKLSNIEQAGQTTQDLKLYVKKVVVAYLFKTLLEGAAGGDTIEYNGRTINLDYLSAKLTDAFFDERGFVNYIKEHKTDDDLRAFASILKHEKADFILSKLNESMEDPVETVKNFAKAYKELYGFVTHTLPNINLSQVLLDLIASIPAYSETLLTQILESGADIAEDVAVQIIAYAAPGAGQLKAAADLVAKGVVLANKIAPYALDAFTAPRSIPLKVQDGVVYTPFAVDAIKYSYLKYPSGINICAEGVGNCDILGKQHFYESYFLYGNDRFKYYDICRSSATFASMHAYCSQAEDATSVPWNINNRKATLVAAGAAFSYSMQIGAYDEKGDEFERVIKDRNIWNNFEVFYTLYKTKKFPNDDLTQKPTIYTSAITGTTNVQGSFVGKATEADSFVKTITAATHPNGYEFSEKNINAKKCLQFDSDGKCRTFATKEKFTYVDFSDLFVQSLERIYGERYTNSWREQRGILFLTPGIYEVSVETDFSSPVNGAYYVDDSSKLSFIDEQIFFVMGQFYNPIYDQALEENNIPKSLLLPPFNRTLTKVIYSQISNRYFLEYALTYFPARKLSLAIFNDDQMVFFDIDKQRGFIEIPAQFYDDIDNLRFALYDSVLHKFARYQNIMAQDIVTELVEQNKHRYDGHTMAADKVIYVYSTDSNNTVSHIAIENRTLYDPVEGDSDNDGLSNEFEEILGTDPQKADSDGDGWSDHYEVMVSGTDPTQKDSDSDTIADAIDPHPLSADENLTTIVTLNSKEGVHLLAAPKLYGTNVVYLTNDPADTPYDKLALVVGERKIIIDDIYEQYTYDSDGDFWLTVIGNVALVKYRKSGEDFNIAVVDITNMQLVKILEEDAISYTLIDSLIHRDYLYSSSVETLYIYDAFEEAFDGYNFASFFQNPSQEMLEAITIQRTYANKEIPSVPLAYRVYGQRAFIIEQKDGEYQFNVYDLTTASLVHSQDIPVSAAAIAQYTPSLLPVSENLVYFIFNGGLYQYDGNILKLGNLDGTLVGVENGIASIIQKEKLIRFDLVNKKVISIQEMVVDGEQVTLENVAIENGELLAYTGGTLLYSQSVTLSDSPLVVDSSNLEESETGTADNMSTCIVANALNRNYDLDEKGIWKYALSDTRDSIYLQEKVVDGESVIEIQGDQKAGSYGLVMSAAALPEGFEENLQPGDYVAYVRLKADDYVTVTVVGGNVEVLSTAERYSFDLTPTFQWIAVPLTYRYINGVTQDYVGVGFKDLDSRIYVDKIVFVRDGVICESDENLTSSTSDANSSEESCSGEDVACVCDAVVVSTIGSMDYVQSMDVEGNYLYIADGPAGLEVIDITNPSSPIYTSSLFTDGYSFNVDVVGGYLYLADGLKGLTIIDISNPEEPILINSIDCGGYVNDVKVENGYAYVAAGRSGLKIIDISNPNAPAIIGSVDTYNARSVVLRGNYVYIADGDTLAGPEASVKIVDVSNPQTPSIAGSIDMMYQVADIDRQGDYLYVAGINAYFRVYDISDPLRPVLVATIDDIYAQSVTLFEDYAFVTASGKMAIFDISTPTSPTLKAIVNTDGDAYDVKVFGTYAYIADGREGLKIIDWQKAIECYELTHRNNPPQIIEYEPVVKINVGESASLALKAYDPDGDSLQWIIEGERFDGNEVRYSFIPRTPGVEEITVKVSDGTYSDEVNTTIVVYPDADHPLTSGFFKDMEAYRTSWPEAYESVYELLNRGIIQGEVGNDGIYYYPQRSASKLEFAKVFVKSVCEDAEGTDNFVTQCLRSLGYDGAIRQPLNIDDINEDVRPYAIVAYNLGVFGDVATTPYVSFGESISRIEVARFLTKTLDLEYVSDIDGHLQPFNDIAQLSLDDQIVTQLVNYYGYLHGDEERFYPYDPLNRAQLAVVAARILRRPTFEHTIEQRELTIEEPMLSITDGNVVIGGVVVASYDPQNESVKVFVNGDEVQEFSNIESAATVEIVIEKDGLRSSKVFTVYSIQGGDDNDRTTDILDDLDELLNTGVYISTDLKEIGLHADEEVAITLRVNSNEGLALNVEVESLNDTLDIQKNWSNPLTLAEYDGRDLVFTIKPKEGVGEVNETVYVTVTDEAGNEEQERISVFILGEKDLYVPVGWSLKTVPVASEVEPSIFSEALIVWKYENGSWKGWSPYSSVMNALRSYGTIDTLKGSEGVWIYGIYSAIKRFVGDTYGSNVLNLHAGWNLIGVGQEMNADEVGTNVKFIWSYKRGEWYLWKRESDDISAAYPQLRKLYPGDGCWAYVEEGR